MKSIAHAILFASCVHTMAAYEIGAGGGFLAFVCFASWTAILFRDEK